MQPQVLRPYFLLALIALALGLVFLIFKPFLTPLLLAAIFAVLLSPVQAYILKKVGGRKGLASVLTLSIALVGILLPLSLLGTVIAIEAQHLYTSLSQGEMGVAERLSSEADRFLDAYLPFIPFSAEELVVSARNYLEQGLQWVLSNSASAAASAARIALDFLLFFFALFYLLRDGERFKRGVITLSPLTAADDARLFGRLERAISSVVKGNLSIALVQGVVAAVGFSLFGVPNAVMWGVATAFAALIPGVGTSLIMFPAVIYTFFATGAGAAIGLFAWAAVAVGLVDNFLGPKLIGSGMRLHPLLVLFSVLGGVAFFGPIGIFMGPLSLSFLAAVVTVYLERDAEDIG